MPPPPTPRHIPPTTPHRHTASATSDPAPTAGTSRALLGELEELRDNLDARVEQLSSAVVRLQVRAREIERALRASTLDLSRLSLRDVTTGPAINFAVPSRTILSGTMAARGLNHPASDLAGRGRPSDPSVAVLAGPDNSRPISQERLDEILEFAMAGATVVRPASRRVPDLSTDSLRGYVPIPIIANDPARTNTVERDVYTSDEFDSYFGGEAVRDREGPAWGGAGSASETTSPRSLPVLGSDIPRSTRYDILMGNAFLDYFGLPPQRVTAMPAASVQQSSDGRPVPGPARSASPVPRHVERDAHRVRHPVRISRRGLTPTNLVESGKTKPIIVKSQPLSPSTTITPDDHIREDIAPLQLQTTAHGERTTAPAPANNASRWAPRESSWAAWSRITRELDQRSASVRDSEPRTGTRVQSGLTLRGQEVAARETGAVSSVLNDIPYDMDDFERDYYLDFENDLGTMVVAPGTGFAMPDTGSAIDLPVLGQRRGMLPVGRTVAEVINMIRREEGERMRALASDIVRHRPPNPSALSRELSAGNTNGGQPVTTEPTDDGTRTPRAGRTVDDSASLDAAATRTAALPAHRFTYVRPDERLRLDRQERAEDLEARPRAAGPDPAAADPALHQEPRPHRTTASPPAADRELSSSSAGTSAEMREREGRTLAAQVQIDITRERARNMARAAAAASEREAREQRLQMLRDLFRQTPESDTDFDIDAIVAEENQDIDQSGGGLMERALGVASASTGLGRAAVDSTLAISAQRTPNEVDLTQISRAIDSGQSEPRLADSGEAGGIDAEVAVFDDEGEAPGGHAGGATRAGQGTSAASQRALEEVLRGSSAVSAQLDCDMEPILGIWPMPIGRRTPRPYVSLLDL